MTSLPKPDSLSSVCGFIRPDWVPDGERTSCFTCKSSFSMFLRRHHCRACGELFCDSCTSRTLDLQHFGYIGEQRVCKNCFSCTTPSPSKPKSKKKRNRSNTMSKPVIQAYMTLTDSLGRPQQRFHFSLTQNSFRWYKKKDEPLSAFHVFLEDIIAVNHPAENEFVIHAYPWHSKKKEKRKKLLIRVLCEDRLQRNEWTEAVRSRLQGKLNSEDKTQRKLMILVNPFGGTKQGHNIWKSAEKLLRVANIELSVRYTEYNGHATTMAVKIQPEEYCGIVCVSGDGLIHEVINGLMNRDDWETAIKIPVGVIPAGSGNALAAELGVLDPLTAAFTIAKGNSLPFDLLHIKQEDVPDTYSFLSVNWGIVSDVDFESERYRFVGGARFTLGALVRCANLRYYHCKLEYVAAPRELSSQFCTRKMDCPCCKPRIENQLEQDNILPAEDEENPTWEVMEGTFVTIVACNISRLSYDVHAAPYAHLSDGYMDLLLIGKCTRAEMLNLFTLLETGEFVNHAVFNNKSYVQCIKVKQYKLTPTSKKQVSLFGFDGEKAASTAPLDVTNRWGLANIIG